MWQRLRHASARVTQRSAAVPKATQYDVRLFASRAQVGQTFASVAKTTTDRLFASVEKRLVSVGRATILGLGSIGFYGGMGANYATLLSLQSVFRDGSWEDLLILVLKSCPALFVGLAQSIFEFTLLPLRHALCRYFHVPTEIE